MEAAGYSEKDIAETKNRALANLIGTLAGTGTTLAGLNAVSAAATAAAGAAGVAGAFSLAPIAGSMVTAGILMQTIRKSTNILNEYKTASIGEKEKKKAEELKANRKRFKTMVMGILYQALISKMVVSKTIETNPDDENDLFLKESLLIGDSQNGRRLDLYFAHFDKEILDEMPLSEDDLAVAVLSSFVFEEPDESKQIDIITNNKAYFASLTQFAHKNSIKANVVSILIDVERAEIINEEVVSTYRDKDDDLIYFVETE